MTQAVFSLTVESYDATVVSYDVTDNRLVLVQHSVTRYSGLVPFFNPDIQGSTPGLLLPCPLSLVQKL